MITIDELMTTDLCVLGRDACLIDIHEIMRKKNIRHVPIVDEGRLLGIVSHRDLMSATPVSFENQKKAYSETMALDIMRTGVETVTSSTSARVAALTLERHKIGCLPVLEGELLIGIVTSSDFVAVAINLMEQSEELESED